MAKTIKTSLREEYNRLKKVLEKISRPGNEPLHSLVLIPLRNKKNGKNTDRR
jgi:hypothetical protein